MWLTLWHLASPMPSLWKVSVKEPGPRPSGYYLAGLRGGRAFLCWERGGLCPCSPPVASDPTQAAYPPYTEAHAELTRHAGAQRAGTQACSHAPALLLGHSLHPGAPSPSAPLASLLLFPGSLAGIWAPFLRYFCPLFSSPPRGTDPNTLCLEPAGSSEGEAGVGTPKGPLPCPFPSLGEAGTPPQARAAAHIPLPGEERGRGPEHLCPWETKTPGARLGEAGWRPPFINIIHETSCVLYS